MANQKMTKRKSLPSLKKHTCEYCNTSFVREETLPKHYEKCAIKARYDYLCLDPRPMKIWALIGYGDVTDKLTFCRSNSFLSIVQSMAAMDELGWILIEEYMTWLIKNKTFYSRWLKRSQYEQFIKLYVKNETPADGITRSLEYLIEQNKFGSFFKSGSINLALDYLESGYISPWLFVLYWNNDAMYDRMNIDQLEKLTRLINFDIYNRKASRFPKSIARLKKELKGVDI